MCELDRRSSAELIDFACSRLWREYYAETMDDVDLPSIYPRGSNELTERINELEGKLKSIKVLDEPHYFTQRINELEERLNKLYDKKKKDVLL